MFQKDETWLKASRSRDTHQGNPSKNGDLIAHFVEVATSGRGNCIDDVCTSRSTKRKSALSRDLRNAMAWRFSYRQLMVNESSVSFSRLNLNSTTRCWLRFQVWAAAGNRACSSSCQM